MKAVLFKVIDDHGAIGDSMPHSIFRQSESCKIPMLAERTQLRRGLRSQVNASVSNQGERIVIEHVGEQPVSNAAEQDRFGGEPLCNLSHAKHDARLDGAFGHSTGLGVSVSTKTGANQFRGTAAETYWNQRWQGANLFTKQNYFRNIAAANASNNTSLAKFLASQPIQPAGHPTLWIVNATGPVWIPKVFNGRNKVFFPFNYNGEKDAKPEESSTYARVVPTRAEKGRLHGSAGRSHLPQSYQLWREHFRQRQRLRAESSPWFLHAGRLARYSPPYVDAALRSEYETGANERYNRAIFGYDKNANSAHFGGGRSRLWPNLAW